MCMAYVYAYKLRVKCFLKVRNYRIFRRGETLRLCMTGKFNNNEIKAEVRFFKGVQQTLNNSHRNLWHINTAVNNNEKCDFPVH